MIIFRKSDQKQTLKVLRVQNCYIGKNKNEGEYHVPDAYAPNVTSETEHELSPSDSKISQTPEIVSTVSKSLYIGSKKNSLATATDVQAPALTPETTSSTATDITLSQNDTDVNSSIFKK